MMKNRKYQMFQNQIRDELTEDKDLLQAIEGKKKQF